MGGQQGSSSSATTWFSQLCASARRFKSLAPPSLETAVRSTSGDSLVRRLGLFDLILLGVGASIGAGVFVVTGTVARDAGPGVTISFLLAGASCVLNALCYAELASRFPAVVGGAYMYSYTAFNEITAFLVFVQLMLDYHIGAASISRSLASYAVALLELFPAFKGSIPLWMGSGQELFGGFLSLNILAPILLALLTLVLCQGVRESSAVNSVMTATKVVIVLVVICAGAFDIDVANWSPFAPNGFKAVLTGATVVLFSYVGFDDVANSAEESKNPQHDLPVGIMGSLMVCISLYIGVCLVLTGMVPFSLLSEDAPLAEAFSSKGMKFVSILISIGAVAGLTTTLLVGLYVQSRLYLGLGRDGLLPSFFSRVHPTLHTPLHSQIWCGIVAGVLAGIFNVHSLSHILSVGTLTGYSVVAACVVALRLNDKKERESSNGWISSWHEGVICLVIIAYRSVSSYRLMWNNGPWWWFIHTSRKVIVVTTHEGVPEEFYGAKVIGSRSFPCPWYQKVPLSLALSPRIISEIARFKPDIIHASSPGIMVFGALAIAKMLSVPIVMSYHTHVPVYIPRYTFSWLVQPMWSVIRFLHRAADLTLVPSAAIGKDLIAAGATAANQLRLWNKGVDSESFNPRFRSQEMRIRLSNGEPEKPLVIHVGRIGVEKSLELLKSVMDKLPEARIAFVGDGPYREDLEKLFTGMPAVFTGMLQGEELSEAYASGDVFVMPSESETLGLVVLEAMASGLPVVAARAGGIPDIIPEDQEGKTGYLFSPGDVEDCVTKLRSLLEDSERREMIGKAAREETEKYDWRAATKKIRNEQYSAAIWFWRKKKAQVLGPLNWLVKRLFPVSPEANA